MKLHAKVNLDGFEINYVREGEYVDSSPIGDACIYELPFRLGLRLPLKPYR